MKTIKVKLNTDIRPQCNFCFDNKSTVLQIEGKGSLTVSICEKCLLEVNKQVNSIKN